MISKLERDIIVGIDLGTTNSEVAVVEGGTPRVLSEGGTGIVPSAVALDDSSRLLVGEPAVNQLLHAPERTVRSIKRKMGTDERVRLGETEYTPEEISAMILRHLKERAERSLGCEVRRAVITIPAFFNDAQRRATREAGELAGLEVVRILHEPTAAALVYEAERYRGRSDGPPRRILVYDLGGGTFDVSIVEVRAGVVEVKASHGDTHLGGDDFDRLLAERVAARFQEAHGVDLLSRPRARARLVRSVEAAKRRLSSAPFALVEEEFIVEEGGRPLHLKAEVSRHEYEDLIRPLVDRSMESVQAALHDAGLLAREVDEIILAGGATRTPLVAEELARRTGKAARFEVDPDLCVALGAAAQGGLIAGEDVHSVLVDITPHSLGIRCLGLDRDQWTYNLFSKVISRGSALPVQRSEVYFTCADRQETVRIEIYQGEGRDVRQNTKLGDFEVQKLSPRPAGNPIVVDFRLDLDGTLKVEAREKLTGTRADIVIEDGLHPFGEEERSAAQGRLARIFNDRGGPAAAGGSPTEAAAALDRLRPVPEPPPASPEEGPLLETARRVEALCGRMVPEDREEAQALLSRLRDHLDAGRLDEARRVEGDLQEILFYLEESSAP